MPHGTTAAAETIHDPAKGRQFPCSGCGAALVFHIGAQSLACPYCGATQALTLPADAPPVAENDYEQVLAKVRAWRAKGESGALGAEDLRCTGCGAVTTFSGTLVSSECAYCGSALERKNARAAPKRIPVDGVIPFLVERTRAAANLKAWVGSRWFAPNEWRRRGVSGEFNGVYLPYWTYDAMTFTRWSGERGTRHSRTVEDSNGQTHTETWTTWESVSGSFQRFFDDVLVCAALRMPPELMQRLEPWPLGRAISFTPDVLAGYVSRSYDIQLDAGMATAADRMRSAIASDVNHLVGGDEQRFVSINTSWSGLSYKHLLLPCWLLAYRFHGKPYQVVVNAATGHVEGERPWSAVKIGLAIAAAMAAVIAIIALTHGSSR